MSYTDNILPVLEGVSYIGSIGILIVATIGLKQLSLTRRASQINAQRDAAKLANEQVRYYLETIIPLINDIDKEIKKEKITIFEKSSYEFVNHGIAVNLQPSQDFMGQFNKIVEPWAAMVNSLESFSTYFTSKLADESIAFKAVGKTYCQTLGPHLPVIASAGVGGNFQDIIELYRMWDARFKAHSLTKQKAEIEKQLNEVGTKTIIPIGADS